MSYVLADSDWSKEDTCLICIVLALSLECEVLCQMPHGKHLDLKVFIIIIINFF